MQYLLQCEMLNAPNKALSAHFLSGFSLCTCGSTCSVMFWKMIFICVFYLFCMFWKWFFCFLCSICFACFRFYFFVCFIFACFGIWFYFYVLLVLHVFENDSYLCVLDVFMFWKMIFIFVLCMLVVPHQFQTHHLSKDSKNVYHPTT
jgi:hypothetical protein